MELLTDTNHCCKNLENAKLVVIESGSVWHLVDES